MLIGKAQQSIAISYFTLGQDKKKMPRGGPLRSGLPGRDPSGRLW